QHSQAFQFLCFPEPLFQLDPRCNVACDTGDDLLYRVHPIAGFRLRGLDVEAVLLRRGRQGSAHAVAPAQTWPSSLGQCRALRPAIISRIFAPLLSARGVLAFAVFLPDVTGFFAAPFADFWSLGTPFFEVARLFVGGQLAAGAMVSTASVKKRAG